MWNDCGITSFRDHLHGICGNNKITKIFFSITFKEKLYLEQKNENRQERDFDKLTTYRKHSLKHQKYRDFNSSSS